MKNVSKFMAEELNAFLTFGHNGYGHEGGTMDRGWALVAVKRTQGVDVSVSIYSVAHYSYLTPLSEGWGTGHHGGAP